MANEREITIRIAAKNLTSAEFAKARSEILGLDEASGKASTGGKSMGPAFSAAFTTIAAGAAVAVTAIGAIAGVVGVLGTHGSEVADVRDHFDLLNKAAGSTGDTMLGVLRTALKGTVSDLAIMKTTNQAMGQGLKLTEDQFELTAKASRVLADRVGGDTAQAYDTLLQAMATGQDRQLKGIGLNIDAEAAVKAHADALGIEVGQMTEAEQQTAKRNAILAELGSTLDATGEAEVDFADLVDQGTAALSNMWDQMSEGVATSPVLAAAFGPIATAVQEAFGGRQGDLIKAIVGIIEDAVYVVVDFGEQFLGVADGFVRGLFSMEAKLSGFAASAQELAAKLPGATEGMKQSAREMRAHADASQRAAEGQNTFSEIVGRLREGLGTARTAMLEARAAQVEQELTTRVQTTATDTLTGAIRRSTTAADANAPATERQTKAQKEHAKELERLDKIYDKVILQERLKFIAGEHITAQMQATNREIGLEVEALGRAETAYFGVVAATTAWQTSLMTGLKPALQDSGKELEDLHNKSLTVVGSIASAFQTLPGIIMGAIQGGGSIWQAAGGHIATSLMETFVTKYGTAIEAALPFGLGKAVTAFLPVLGSLFGPVAEKIGNFFRNIFGGPSDAERDGRRRVAEFEKQLQSTLTETQKLEAGTDAWKQTVVAVRDAYLAAGRTEAEAMAAVERLWDSSRLGAGAVEAAIEDINAVLKATGSQTLGFIAAVTTSLNAIPTEIDITVNGHYNPPEIDGDGGGYAVGTLGRHGAYFVDFGAEGTSVRTHGREAIITAAQAPGFVASWLSEHMPARAGGAAPVVVNVHTLVDQATGALRVVSETEFLRRKVNQMARTGLIQIPSRAVGATV